MDKGGAPAIIDVLTQQYNCMQPLQQIENNNKYCISSNHSIFSFQREIVINFFWLFQIVQLYNQNKYGIFRSVVCQIAVRGAIQRNMVTPIICKLFVKLQLFRGMEKQGVKNQIAIGCISLKLTLIFSNFFTDNYLTRIKQSKAKFQGIQG
eukprot:TRINITY_DN9006_c0_g3_i2.p2 TRINITY_DN9006_c0_g3~~TRINITY_DN9006_c0_g3_i2.p2  ORF type:complete len:162 (+),score=0.35 TRINITY_DN9006_c0_g3_i2:36-488(+)